MGLGTVSFDYFTPEIPGLALPVTVDPTSDLDVIQRVCSELPCVVVLITGRPLFIEEAIDASDAFVVAWLPGAEGAGVADVLYGRRGLDFTAKLAHTWPATPRDPSDPSRTSPTPELDYVPQNEFVNGDGNLDAVLFPLGYGLSTRR
jgi:Glycosyl hydrolase family 3 C-terminal domain